MNALRIPTERFSPHNTVDPHGRTWPFAMTHLGHTVFADTRTELIGAIITGYANLPAGNEGDSAAAELRYLHIVKVANQIQALNNLDAHVVDGYDVDTASEDEITALMEDRLSYVHRDTEPWEGVQTLVLIATDYAPYNPGIPLPTGNVLILDPYSETTFLAALEQAEVLTLRVAD